MCLVWLLWWNRKQAYDLHGRKRSNYPDRRVRLVLVKRLLPKEGGKWQRQLEHGG